MAEGEDETPESRNEHRDLKTQGCMHEEQEDNEEKNAHQARFLPLLLPCGTGRHKRISDDLCAVWVARRLTSMNNQEQLALLADHFALMDARMTAEVVAPRHHVMDVLNPGTSRPEEHSRPPIPVSMAVSISTSAHLTKNSNGDGQRLNLDPGQQGVSVLEVPRLSTRAYNGNFQHRNFKPIDQGTTKSAAAPLPTNINVASQNLHVAPLLHTLERPPAIDVKAGDRKPGGLPTSVAIR